jgi:hypothetical protein
MRKGRTQYTWALKLALHEYKENAKLSVMKSEVDHKKVVSEYMLQASSTQALSSQELPTREGGELGNIQDR